MVSNSHGAPCGSFERRRLMTSFLEVSEVALGIEQRASYGSTTACVDKSRTLADTLPRGRTRLVTMAVGARPGTLVPLGCEASRLRSPFAFRYRVDSATDLNNPSYISR